MRKKVFPSFITALVALAMLLTACAPAATPVPTAAAPAAQPTDTTAPVVQPTDTAAAAAPTTSAEPTATTAAAVPTTTAVPATSNVDMVYENVDPKGAKVVFWHNHTQARQDALQQIIDDFNKTNEWGITVTQENQGSYADIFNKMLPLLNTPDVPNLVVAYQNQAATYQLANALVDMRALVNSPKWGMPESEQKAFFPGFWAQDIFPNFDNARLGFPAYRSEEVLYYNQAWLKELGYDAPPTTPDQFKEMACKAAKQPYSKATAQGSTGYEFDPGDASHFAAWTFAFGGNIYDSKTGQYTYNSQGAVQAAQFLQSLFKDGCISLVTEQYGDQTDFGAGKTLFTTSSTSGLPFYKSAVDGGAAFNWSVAAIPHSTPDPIMDIYGASISIPKSTPQQELAAWLFLKYFTTPAVQAKWAEVSGYFPARADVANQMQDYMSKNSAYQAGFNLLKYGIFEPPVPGYDFVRDMLNKTIAQIVASPYPDPKPLLDQLNTDANANLKDQLSQMKK